MWEEYKYFARTRTWATAPTVADLLAVDELETALTDRFWRDKAKEKA